MTASVFPVRPTRGEATYVDTWGAPRSGGRKHQGTDIYAERGSDVLAVDEGWAQAISGALTGHGVALTSPDGVRYVYAHLDDYVGPLPRRVGPGDVIGRLGSTGNAAGGRPHLHFEVLPTPGVQERVNPAPILARLLTPMRSSPLAVTPKQPIEKPKSKKTSTNRGSMGLMVPLLLLAIASRKRRSGQ